MYKVIYAKYVGENNDIYDFQTYEDALSKASELAKDTVRGIPVIQSPKGLEYVPVNFVDNDGNIFKDISPSVMNLVLFPEKGILTPSTPLTPDELLKPELKQLIFSMYMTMYVYKGIGLAAPQIGLNRQLFVVDTQYTITGEARPKVFINPSIKDFEGEQEGIEGCLSSPGLCAKMSRPERVVMTALGLDGVPFDTESYGLLSACLSHEFEHLNGRVIAAKASNYDRSNYLREYKRSSRRIKKSKRII